MKQLGVVVETLSQGRQRLHVLAKTTAAVANPDIEVARTDSLVEAHPLGDQLGVSTYTFGDSGNLVDERDTRGEKCIRRVLDHLGRVDVRRDEDGRLPTLLWLRDPLRGAAPVAPPRAA